MVTTNTITDFDGRLWPCYHAPLGIRYHYGGILWNIGLYRLLKVNYLCLNGRAGGIRTHDLLNPIQAHYQAVLRPDFSRNAKDAKLRGLCNRKGFTVRGSQFTAVSRSTCLAEFTEIGPMGPIHGAQAAKNATSRTSADAFDRRSCNGKLRTVNSEPFMVGAA